MSASAKKKLRKEENAAQLTEKQLKEKNETKKLKIYTTIFVVAIALVLVAGIVIGISNYIKGSGVMEKNTVAAVVNDQELNSVELSYYYSDIITTHYNSWSTTYGDSMSLYLSLMGLDITQPLGDQEHPEGNTWADYFIESAIEKAKSDYSLCAAAEAEGFTLPAEEQEALDASIEQLPFFASVYGYSSVDSYLRSVYGSGASEDSYAEYSERVALANAYYTAYSENLNIDDAAIRAYEADKYDEFSSFTYATYRINYYDYLTGGTEDADGNVTYSDAEKEAARAAAKAVADAFPTCASEEEFNAAIAALDVNADTDAECTVFEDSLYTTTNTAAREWLAEDGRKNGDFIVVPSESTVSNEAGEDITVVNDYYAVLFLERNDNNMPLANVRHILVNFEGGTTDDAGNTTYTDEEKAAALAEAEAILDEYLAGEATEDSFVALVSEYTDDYASSASGGLYEDITPEQGIYVESFTNWAIDPSREAGDTGIIESTYGYHIMYYVGDDELSYRDHMITEQIRTESLDTWYNEILATGTATAKDTSRLNRDIIISQ